MAKKKNKNSSMVTLYAELNKNIPAQGNALAVLEEYQQQTGLSKKDALVFMLLAFGQMHVKQDVLPFSAGTLSFGERPVADFYEEQEHESGAAPNGKKPLETVHKADAPKEELLSPDMESFLDENMEDFL